MILNRLHSSRWGLFALAPASILLTLSLSGCGFKPYVPPVEQGTEISPAMIQQLHVGMTEDQVQYLLGTPDIKDPYHPNTWYYVHTSERNHKPMTEQTLMLTFSNQTLTTLSGTYLSAEASSTAETPSSTPASSHTEGSTTSGAAATTGTPSATLSH